MNESMNHIPEVNFIANKTLEEVQTELVQSYQEKYTELTGKEMALSMASPYRLILNACALQIYQGFRFVDAAGKKIC